MSRRIFEFGPFRLDAERYELLRGGRPVATTPKVLDVLVALIEKRGRVALKPELMQALWPDHVVEESNLAQNISSLRRILGDGSEDQAYIRTVPRKGYTFVADVRMVEDELAAAVPAATTARRRWGAAAAVAFLAAVVALGLRVAGPRDSPPIASLAVLPLQNLSDDPDQEYFADGLTEALITDLAVFLPLRVISRTSVMQFKGTKARVPEIGRRLGADAVVEGSVLRSGERVRITVQLIDARTDAHLWAESYEKGLGDILELQAEVATAIAREVHGVLSTRRRSARLAQGVPPAAYENYLRGRHAWNKRNPDGLKQAIGFFEEAVHLSPGFAEAHAGLADTYAVMPTYGFMSPELAFPAARAAALRALELDADLASARACLGLVRLHHEWDWDGAERELRRAIELNPRYATARQWYAEWLTARGRHDAALEQIALARDLDPLSAVVQTNVGRHLYFARRYEPAVEALEAATELAPLSGVARGLLALSLARAGRFRDAEAAAEESGRAAGLRAPPALAQVKALSGDRRAAEEMLPGIEADIREHLLPSFLLAAVLAELGRDQAALDWLEEACRGRVPLLIFVGVDPAFDGLRDEPRFVRVLESVGLRPPRGAASSAPVDPQPLLGGFAGSTIR